MDAYYEIEREFSDEFSSAISREIVRKMYRLAAERFEKESQSWDMPIRKYNEADPYGEENWDD